MFFSRSAMPAIAEMMTTSSKAAPMSMPNSQPAKIAVGKTISVIKSSIFVSVYSMFALLIVTLAYPALHS
jgi:hypothetical protein